MIELKMYLESGIPPSLDAPNNIWKFLIVGFATKNLGGNKISSSIGFNA